MKAFQDNEYPELPPDVVGMDLHDEDCRVCLRMFIRLCEDQKLAQRLLNRIRLIEKKIKDDEIKRVIDRKEVTDKEFIKSNPDYQREYRTRKKLEREQNDA